MSIQHMVLGNKAHRDRTITVGNRTYTTQEVFNLDLIAIHDLETELLHEVQVKADDLNMFRFVRHLKTLAHFEPRSRYHELANKPYDNIDALTERRTVQLAFCLEKENGDKREH